MAPRNTTGRAVPESSTSTVSDDRNETPDVTANLQAEIERLTGLLHESQARNQENPSEQTITMLTESIVQALGWASASPITPEPKRSAKIPDPPILTDGLDPTYESWKIQIQAKLSVNDDHFANNAA